MNRDDGEGFHPHPGDPWHPAWSDGTEPDELDEAPEPREGEDRAGFLKRLLGRPDDEPGDEASTEHVYDPIREREDVTATETVDREEVAAVAEESGDGMGETGGDTADADATDEFEVVAVAEADAAAESTIEIPVVDEVAAPEVEAEEATELLGEVSFDAQSGAAFEAEWELAAESDGNRSDGVVALQADLERATAADEADLLDTELNQARSAMRDVEADHAGESATAAATAASAEEAAAIEAELHGELVAAAAGSTDAESEVAGDDAQRAESSLADEARAEAIEAQAAEREAVAAQIHEATAAAADEEARRLEMTAEDDEAAAEAASLDDELARASRQAEAASDDQAIGAVDDYEDEMAASHLREEELLAEAELAAAMAATAAEREQDAVLLGTDDAATSFQPPEVALEGFVFEAPPGEEEPSVEEEPMPLPAAPDGAAVAASVAMAAGAGAAADSAQATRRGWRRFLPGRRGAAGVAAAAAAGAGGEPAEIEGQALASEVMAADTRRPDDDSGELHLDAEPGEEPFDEPHLMPAAPDAGFEGWLGGEEGGGQGTGAEDTPAADGETHPYGDLADVDAAGEEIAEWMAFTEGTEGQLPADEHLTEELPAVADEDEEEDDTTEFLLDEAAAEEEGDQAATAAGEEDLSGAASPEEPDDEVEDAAVPTDDAEKEEVAVPDETEEVVVPIGTVRAIAEFDEEEAPEDIVELGFDAFEDFAEDEYLRAGAATSDHTGLAAAIAAAEGEETEQVALSAAIPGLETGVVGFEDVVAAEGQFAGSASSPRASDLAVRVGSAFLLIAVFLVSLLYRPALIGLALVVFVLAAGEFYTVLMRKGYRPLALFGFIGLAGATLGTVAWGPIAIPMALALTSLLILLFFAVVPGRLSPLMNYSITITVAAWVGLGAFAVPIIQSERYRTLVLAAVAAVALMDIASYFVGRTLGRNQLAPVISPKKTWEGLVGGVVVALLIGALLHYFPPFELTSGLLLGAVVAIVAPLGDLAVSVVKRTLGVKDMGAILPGHGGLVDRIDALLFVIPAAWALYTWLDLL